LAGKIRFVFFLPDLLNWELENGNWKIEKTGLGKGSQKHPEPRTKPNEANGLNAIIIKEIR